MIRGDVAFGVEPIMVRAQGLETPYLFKLRLTKNVKGLIEKLFNDALWQPAGQGWEGTDSEVRRSVWTKSRRVLVLRRRIRQQSVTRHDEQLRLAHPDTHLEAITSRPLLLHAVAKQTEHAGQRPLTITSTHAMAATVQRCLSRLSAFPNALKETAEQLDPVRLMHRILSHAFRILLGGMPLTPPHPSLDRALK
jgi:hypothetical protein